MSVSAIQGVLTINFRVAFYHYKLSLICLVILPSLSDQNSKIDWIFCCCCYLVGWVFCLFIWWFLCLGLVWLGLCYTLFFSIFFWTKVFPHNPGRPWTSDPADGLMSTGLTGICHHAQQAEVSKYVPYGELMPQSMEKMKPQQGGFITFDFAQWTWKISSALSETMKHRN